MSTTKPLLILDVDETLIYVALAPLARPPDFYVHRMPAYRRPYLDDFVRHAASLFRLGIWSSATEDYLGEAIPRIIPSSIELAFAWGRKRCTPRVDSTRQGRVTYLKDLKKVRRHGFDLRHVLVVDDSPEKVERSYGNAIYVSPYEGALEDMELPALSRYLNTLVSADDVRQIEKRGWRNAKTDASA